MTHIYIRISLWIIPRNMATMLMYVSNQYNPEYVMHISSETRGNVLLLSGAKWRRVNDKMRIRLR
jgi:hypothetical protein